MELKPCPFCGAKLEQGHNHYIAINGKTVDYYYYVHPLNGCILEDRICGAQCLSESEIKQWNERGCL